MKPRSSNVMIERTDDAQVIKMEIDAEGLPMLMGMLSGMYNDPALAVIREYTTNAIDANVEAGVDRPVDVYLPSELGEPEFIVVDYGHGMSKQDVIDTYSKYVKSTKRHSNDVAGMFGIGSKSALAYTGQFTVESVKDGMLTRMTISKTAGAPEIEVREFKTDRHSGTTVKVPVGNRNTFNAKAKHHFSFLKEGVVNVNGQDLGGAWRETKVADGVYAHNDLSSHYVVMGNVPYPLPDKIGYEYDNYGRAKTERTTRGKFLFEIELGEFMPAPAREGLELDDKDTQRVRNLILNADEQYLENIKKDIANAKTVMDKATAINTAYNETMRTNYVHGLLEAKVGEWEIDYWSVKATHALWDSDRDVKNYDYAKIRHNDFQSKRTVIFYNADDEISDYYRKKISDWCKHNDHYDKWIGLKSKPGKELGYDKSKVLDFSVVKDWSRPTSGTGSSARSGMWHVITGVPYKDNWQDGRTPFTYRNTKKIPEGSHSNVLVYVSPTDYDEGVTLVMIDMAVSTQDVCLVKMGKNRWAKLQRDYPNAVHIKDWYEDERSKRMKGLTEEHLRRPVKKLQDLDSSLHKRYNERKKTLDNLRKEAIKALGENQVNLMSTGTDPEISRIRNEIEERYPYLPSYVYRDHDKKQANEYIAAMDAYYKEKKND